MQILSKSKIVVFDINKTLVYLTRQKIPGIYSHFHTNTFYGYFRPNFHYLTYHQQFLSQKLTFLLWTSKKKQNAQKISKILQKQGFKFDKLYYQDHCRLDLSKDLNLIAQQFKVDTHNVYLIDDSIEKVVDGQNLIIIKQYKGIETEDKELVRIVKQLYSLAQITMKNQIQSEAIAKEAEGRLKLMSISEQKSTKKQKKKKYVEKSQLKKQKNMQEKQNKLLQNIKIRKQIKQGTKIKCIVFDIYGTLIYRSSLKIEGIDASSSDQYYFYYIRPHLTQLKQFIQNYNVKMCLWSSMSSNNCEKFSKLLYTKGLNIHRIFSNTEMTEGKKNLQHASKCLQIPIQNIVLVDDSLQKRVEGQNFINISEYDGTNSQDDSLLHLIQELKKICQEKSKD